MNLHDSINDKSAEIDRLRAEVTTLQGERDRLQDDYGSRVRDCERLEAEVARLTAENEALRATSSEQSKTISYLLSCQAESLKENEALRAELADVRALDEWAETHRGRSWSMRRNEPPLATWCCKTDSLRWWNQGTPESARRAAVEFLKKESGK